MTSWNTFAQRRLRIEEQHIGDVFVGREQCKIGFVRNSQSLYHRLAEAHADEGNAFRWLCAVQLDEIGIGSANGFGDFVVCRVRHKRDHAHPPAQRRGKRRRLFRPHIPRRIAVKNEPRKIGSRAQNGTRILLLRDATDFYLHHRAPLIRSN